MTPLLLSLLLAVPLPVREALESPISTESGFSAVFNAPAPFVESVSGHDYLRMQGFSVSCLQGDFIRPSLTVYIPVPPGSDPVLEYQVLETGSAHVARGFSPSVSPVLEGSGLDASEVFPEAPTATGPSDVVVMRSRHLAGMQMASLTFYPFTGGSFGSFASRVRVRLSWDSAPGATRLDGGLASLICPEGVLCWPGRVAAGGGRASGRDVDDIFWGRPWARLAISATGCHAVSCEDLEAAGCEVEGSPSTSLRMFTGPGLQFAETDFDEEHSLQEVPLLVFDGSDGTFDRGDSLIFLGMGLSRFEPIPAGRAKRLSSRYAVDNVYWLTWGGEDGMRIQERSAAPDGSPSWGSSFTDRTWYEQDWIWIPGRDTISGWAWSELNTFYPSYFGIYCPGVAGAGALRVSLLADEWGPHNTIFSMGTEEFADTTWGGYNEHVFRFDGVPLVQGTNLLKVDLVDGGAGSLGVFFNNLTVEYPRVLSEGPGRELLMTFEKPGRYTFDAGGFSREGMVFDWSDRMNPMLLEGVVQQGQTISFSTFMSNGDRLFLADASALLHPDSIVSAAPGRIRGTLNGAGVVFVAGPGLEEGAAVLASACEARGLRAEMVTAREVYDEFGQGVTDPGAIRSFLRWALESWDPAPYMLVLVGDGHYDPLNFTTPTPSLIPAWEVFGSSETVCADDYYAMTSSDAFLPEIAVSRVPADTPQELSQFTAKLLAYSTGEADGEWANRLLLIADDEWGEYSMNEDDHTMYCEALADTIVRRSLDRDKFYLIEYPWTGGREKPEAREDLVVSLSQGCAAAAFFGHGSYGQIAHEKLLVTSDVARLTNGMRLPVISFASCDVGRFDMISTDCMGEAFVLQPGGGAIGAIGGTRGTTSTTNKMIFCSYYDLLCNQEVPPGEALWAAKVLNPDLYDNTALFYVFFGDGTLPLRRSEPLPQEITVEGDTLLRGRECSLSAAFEGQGTALLEVRESASWTDYTCLGGTVITYLKYGGPAFRGTFPFDGPLEVNFFVPVQADTGMYARAAANGLSGEGCSTAWDEWAVLADEGGYSADSAGPDIEIWLDGHRGEPVPVSGPEAVFRASLADPSGIAAFGGSAGRAILVNLDQQAFDVSGYFSYLPGSVTGGVLEYDLPTLFEGQHRIILACWDGMGNSARDTLDFQVTEIPDDVLSEVLVYPNPAEGLRCFSFMAATDGVAEVTVYTTAGRAIWRWAGSCVAGYCQVIWNGLDLDGDPPASGPYIYRIEYDPGEGGSASSTGILAVIRKDDDG